MVHPDDRAVVQQAWADACERGLPLDLDYRIIRADAQLLWVNARAVAERGRGRHGGEAVRHVAGQHGTGGGRPRSPDGRDPLRDRVRAGRDRHRDPQPRRNADQGEPGVVHAARAPGGVADRPTVGGVQPPRRGVARSSGDGEDRGRLRHLRRRAALRAARRRRRVGVGPRHPRPRRARASRSTSSRSSWTSPSASGWSRSSPIRRCTTR